MRAISHSDTRRQWNLFFKENRAHLILQHSLEPTDEPEKVSIRFSIMICLMGSILSWGMVYWLLREVLG